MVERRQQLFAPPATVPHAAAAPTASIKKKGKRREAAKVSGERHSGGASSSRETPTPSAGGSANSRIFVGRLPQKTTEAELRTHFSGCGTVTEVDMLTRRTNGRFKGAAFVQFESAAGAASALALDGQEINGKAAAVQAAAGCGATSTTIAPATTAAPAAPAVKASAPTVEPPAGASSIFVGNLPEGVTEKAVRKIFRPCGPIQKIKLLPAVKGEVRGFIDFRFAAGAAAAVELNGSAQLGGRRVVVGTARRTASVKRDRRSMEARARRKEARQEARGEDAAPVG